MEITNLVRTNIKNLQPYSSARDEFTEVSQKMIYLDANENPFDTGVNRYSDPHQKELKKALSELKKVNQNNILIGNGSDEVLDLLFRCFCEPYKDNVITLPPTYGMYGVLSEINAIENREVLLDADFQPDGQKILSVVDENTKIIFLCSPNNPTGNSFKVKSIKQLLEHFNGLVVVDEAYIDFSEKESWLNQLENYPNLIVIQTLSKAYGLAGLRVGILYASEKIITLLSGIKLPYNSNVLSQKTAIEIFKNNKYFEDKLTEILEEKKRLFKVLLQIQYIQKAYDSEANFILIKMDDALLRYQQLLAKGIVVRNRSKEPLCENCLRITIGTKQENEILINALQTL